MRDYESTDLASAAKLAADAAMPADTDRPTKQELYETDVSFRLKIPPELARDIVGRDDDDSPEWIEELESKVGDSLATVLPHIDGDPSVECL